MELTGQYLRLVYPLGWLKHLQYLSLLKPNGTAMKKRRLNQIIAENVRTVCKKFNVNTVELCKKTGKSPSSISKLINANIEPKLDTVEAVAEGLDIEPWLLFIDHLNESMLTEERLTKLVNNFCACSPELRDTIMDYVNHMVELEDLRKRV